MKITSSKLDSTFDFKTGENFNLKSTLDRLVSSDCKAKKGEITTFESNLGKLASKIDSHKFERIQDRFIDKFFDIDILDRNEEEKPIVTVALLTSTGNIPIPRILGRMITIIRINGEIQATNNIRRELEDITYSTEFSKREVEEIISFFTDSFLSVSSDYLNKIRNKI